MNKFAFIFPGQGSQYQMMGKDFFDTFAVAKHVFEEADELLSCKISEIIFSGSELQLKQTRNSQLAIFINSMAILRTVEQQFPSLVPYVCAGLSLGEYTALTASKRLDFATTLKLVRDRAHFMNEACEDFPGAMAAVLGLDVAKLEECIEDLSKKHQVWVANYNYPRQTVISGTPQGIEIASKALLEAGAKKVVPLQVHGAFHSGLMSQAQDKLAPKITKAPIQESSVKFVMNVTANFSQNIEEVRENLINQVTQPVRWNQSVQTMMKDGVDCFVEMGSGKTLTSMNKKIGVDVPCYSIDKVFDLDVLMNQFCIN